jgi:hypothetical protein
MLKPSTPKGWTTDSEIKWLNTIGDVLEEENLDNDQKVALWSLLPSHIRSGIKKEQDARRVAA